MSRINAVQYPVMPRCLGRAVVSICVLLSVSWLGGCRGCQGERFGSQPNGLVTVRELPRCNSRFAALDAPDEVRWRGGDNGQIAVLSDGRVIWVFSDSWVGKRKGSGRHEATIVRNTLAIQASRSCDSNVQFHWRQSSGQKPSAFFKPKGGEGFYWPLGVAFDAKEKRLLIACGWLKKNPKPSNVFDSVVSVGSVLLVVENPLDAPDIWRIREQLIARVGTPAIQYGLQLWQDPTVSGRWLFLGSQELGGGKTAISLHQMTWSGTAAEPPMKDLRTLMPDGSWGPSLVVKRKILFEGASQSSVHFDPVKKRYVALYARGWEGIWMRTSPTLTSGWSDKILLYRFPELQKSKDVFCGTLGSHLVLGRPGHQFPLTYMCNSTDFFSMAGDMSLYVPVFLELQMK